MPAAACGVVGLKPALGAVSTEGVFRWPRASTPSGRWRGRPPTARSPTRSSRGAVPAPRIAGLRVGVLGARPDVTGADAAGAARPRGRAGRGTAARTRGGRPRGRPPAPARRHVAALPRRRGRRPRRDVPGAARRVRPDDPVQARHGLRVTADERRGASRPWRPGAPARGASRKSTSSPRRRSASPSCPRRRRRARRARAFSGYTARSATWAGRRSRSAACSSPGATPASSSAAALALEREGRSPAAPWREPARSGRAGARPPVHFADREDDPDDHLRGRSRRRRPAFGRRAARFRRPRPARARPGRRALARRRRRAPRRPQSGGPPPCAAPGAMRAAGGELRVLCEAESGLPAPRVAGELERACVQLGLFAGVVERGDHLEATHRPRRAPTRSPSRARTSAACWCRSGRWPSSGQQLPAGLRRAGGDSAAALSAGCPVLAKGHPSQPGVIDLVGRCVAGAVAEAGLPDGTSRSSRRRPELGQALVDAEGIARRRLHRLHRGGRALFDRAARRTRPIPVFAEMGSVNPASSPPPRCARAPTRSATRCSTRSRSRPASCARSRASSSCRRAPTATASSPARVALEATDALVMLNDRLLRASTPGWQLAGEAGTEVLAPDAGAAAPGFRHAPVAVSAGRGGVAHEALREERFGPPSSPREQLGGTRVAAWRHLRRPARLPGYRAVTTTPRYIGALGSRKTTHEREPACARPARRRRPRPGLRPAGLDIGAATVRSRRSPLGEITRTVGAPRPPLRETSGAPREQSGSLAGRPPRRAAARPTRSRVDHLGGGGARGVYGDRGGSGAVRSNGSPDGPLATKIPVARKFVADDRRRTPCYEMLPASPPALNPNPSPALPAAVNARPGTPPHAAERGPQQRAIRSKASSSSSGEVA